MENRGRICLILTKKVKFFNHLLSTATNTNENRSNYTAETARVEGNLLGICILIVANNSCKCFTCTGDFFQYHKNHLFLI